MQVACESEFSVGRPVIEYRLRGSSAGKIATNLRRSDFANPAREGLKISFSVVMTAHDDGSVDLSRISCEV